MPRRRWASACRAGFSPFLLICGGTLAVPETMAQPPAPAEITPASQFDLARLIDLAAARLRIAVDYDPAALKQHQVTLRLPAAISDAELWRTTNRLLAQKGLTTVIQAGADGFSVVKLDDAPRLARLEPPFVLAAEAAAPPAIGPGFRNIAIRLAHISARDAVDAAKPYLRVPTSGPGAAVAAGPGLITISDLSPRIDEALAVLQSLDRPENATVIEPVAVRNISPAQVVTAVTQLAARRDAVGGDKLPGEVVAHGTAGAGSVLVIAPRRLIPAWSELISQADQREPVETVTYSPRVFAVREVSSLIQQLAGGAGPSGGAASTDDRFRIVTEEPTGTILVTATPSMHGRFRELMERLDNVPGEVRRPVRTFAVRNRSVAELVSVLERMIAAGVLDGAAAGPQPDGIAVPATAHTPPAASGVSPATLPGGSNPMTVAPGAVSTAPLLRDAAAGSTTPGSGRGMVAGLPISLTADEATNTIVAIGDARLLQQLDQLIRTLDVRQPQVMLEIVLVSLSDTDSLSLGVELERIVIDGRIRIRLASLFGLSTPITIDGEPARTTGEAPGFGGVVLSPGEFSVVVRALENITRGRSMTLPKVLVSNNQRATFNGVLQQPFAASFTAGNASTPTTSFGGTQDAGTQLTVKPQIGEGDTLLLDYSISLSQFSGSAASVNLPPPRQVNSVQSTASIPDGYTVVVGGLEVQSETNTVAQIPVLGSIPIVGTLFKNETNGGTRNRFFVFLRAAVMRGDSLEALRYISDEHLERAAVPSNWPQNRPQVIR